MFARGVLSAVLIIPIFPDKERQYPIYKSHVDRLLQMDNI